MEAFVEGPRYARATATVSVHPNLQAASSPGQHVSGYGMQPAEPQKDGHLCVKSVGPLPHRDQPVRKGVGDLCLLR